LRRDSQPLSPKGRCVLDLNPGSLLRQRSATWVKYHHQSYDASKTQLPKAA
jgi:hypothetical protein